MRHNLPSEDFITLAKALWKDGLPVKYKNPDAWVNYLMYRLYKHRP